MHPPLRSTKQNKKVKVKFGHWCAILLFFQTRTSSAHAYWWPRGAGEKVVFASQLLRLYHDKAVLVTVANHWATGRLPDHGGTRCELKSVRAVYCRFCRYQWMDGLPPQMSYTARRVCIQLGFTNCKFSFLFFYVENKVLVFIIYSLISSEFKLFLWGMRLFISDLISWFSCSDYNKPLLLDKVKLFSIKKLFW